MNTTILRLIVIFLSPVLMILGLSHLGMQSALGEIVLTDDFNDNSIDPAKWTTNTSIPQGSASVVEKDGHMELTNRGHLVSYGEFDPDTAPGLKITGQWAFAQLGTSGENSYTYLQIFTRSDGIPAGSYGGTQNGIEYRFYWWESTGPVMTMSTHGSSLTIGDLTQTGTIDFSEGDVFDFEILDQGTTGLSFTMTEVGNASNTASVMTVLTSDTFDQNHVVFHNCQYSGGDSDIAYLDDVTVQFIPEPATLTLLVCGGLVLLLWAWRRRK